MFTRALSRVHMEVSVQGVRVKLVGRGGSHAGLAFGEHCGLDSERGAVFWPTAEGREHHFLECRGRLAGTHYKNSCAKGFSLSFTAVSAGGRSLAFMRTAWASRKRSSPTAASTRWRHAASLGRLLKMSQPALTGCGRGSQLERGGAQGSRRPPLAWGSPGWIFPPLPLEETR